MTNEQFETEFYPKYKSTIQAIARKLARENDDLVEELFQEGCIAMLNCKPEKAKTNQSAFIRQAIKFRMIDYLRRELKHMRTESLDVVFPNEMGPEDGPFEDGLGD